MTDEIELVSIRYQNVRGFYDATLPLDNTKSLIVGRNHAGKTSAFLLLSWLINEASPDRLLNNDNLTEHECALLLPARSARHTARRISLSVQFSDGRKARPFDPIGDKFAMLRIGFRISGTPSAFVQLGEARRDSGSESQQKAAELLGRLQELYSVVHIPSARDASSDQFRTRFRNLFRDKLAERALHPGRQSGSTTEFKKIVTTSRSLKDLAADLLDPLLKDLAESLPNGLLQSPSLDFREGTERSVVDWIVDQVVLKLITGAHDDEGVRPSSVGAGLQSVLDIAATSVILGHGEKKLIVAVEEPEAFLHPSLQRTIARRILSEQYGYKTFVSTHSPILVSEARYDELLLAVDQRIRVPKRETDQRRIEIHTALLSGQGAEMVFAASVLLVEGEGDLAFFEGLRRRLAQWDTSGRVDNLYVVHVGSSSSFGQWLKLLRALNSGGGEQPIKYLVVPDGDATTEVLRAFRESGLDVDSEAVSKLQKARQSLADNRFSQWCSDLHQANKALLSAENGNVLHFFEGDLEWAIFSSLTEDKCEEIAGMIGMEFVDKDSFIKRMGSKVIDGKSRKGHKAPHLRRQTAEKIEFSEISKNVKQILLCWLTNAEFTLKEAKHLIRGSKGRFRSG
ncbi:MAG: AAA family ATPase [Rhodospirillales bacterium]|nr:AAA family ATPase [Rhodospirillales bacterium]